MAQLYRVILPVTNIEAAKAFYSSILGSDGVRVSPGRHYFDCEGTILACFDPRPDGDGYDATPNPEPIYFAVDNLEAAYEACRQAGASIPDEVDPSTGPGSIAVRPWGERSFYASDPFGNKICFVSRDSVFRG